MEEILAILASCPELIDLAISGIKKPVETDHFAQFVVSYYPNLRNLSQHRISHDCSSVLFPIVKRMSERTLPAIAFNIVSDQSEIVLLDLQQNFSFLDLYRFLKTLAL